MPRKKLKLKSINIISVIFFILVSSFYLLHEKYPFLRQQESTSGTAVVAIHDGDTVSVTINRKQEKVRLIGIDAPELGQIPWGEEAKTYLESLIDDSEWRVQIEYDVEKRDKYGRILAYLKTSDGQQINFLMVKNGYALLFTLPPNVKYVNDLTIAQHEARTKGLGIWSQHGLNKTPIEYRKEHPRI